MLPNKVIRRFLKEEITSGMNSAVENCKSEPDFVKSLIFTQFYSVIERINSAATREDFAEIISYCGYRMTLEDWEMYYEKE